MSVLAGWGADAADGRYEIEAVHQRTGEKRTFVFEAPVGAAAIKMRLELADLGESAAMSAINAVTIQACCAELADEDVEVVERLVMLTGGAQSPLIDGVAMACSGKSVDQAPGWEVQGAVPFSSSETPDSTPEG